MLAIAGSMPVVKGKGLITGAWGKLVQELQNVATKLEASDEGSNSLNVVLETSFNALALTKQREFKKTAVLAPGAVASTEMLLNLWETEVHVLGVPLVSRRLTSETRLFVLSCVDGCTCA